jgi:putative regulator of septum formation
MRHRIAFVLALVVATGGACSDDKKPQLTQKFVHDLQPGDCFTGSPGPAPNVTGGKRTVLVVGTLPCSDSHDKEVFGIFEHPAKPGGPYPGQKEVAKVAQDGCAERFGGYVGRPFGDSDLQVAVIAPGPVPWEEDNDRRIVCTLQGNKPLKGSKKTTGG